MPSLHLSDGGGQNRSKKIKAARPLKPSLEPLPSTAAAAASNGKNAPSRDGESAFCRALASGDPSTRLRALDALVAWLVAKGNSAANSVSRDDMRKLWKGMFYSYWHSDLAPVQVRKKKNEDASFFICMRRLEQGVAARRLAKRRSSFTPSMKN